MILFAALMLLDGLTLWAIIQSKKGWWSVKAAALLAAAILNFFTLSAFTSGNGWPVSGLPKQAQYLGCDPVEPDPQSHNPGAIYIFGVPTKEQHHVIGYSSHFGEPRIYRLPYSRQLEQECTTQQKKASQGAPVMVGSQKLTKKGSHNIRGHHVFYHLPPSYLPRKK